MCGSQDDEAARAICLSLGLPGKWFSIEHPMYVRVLPSATIEDIICGSPSASSLENYDPNDPESPASWHNRSRLADCEVTVPPTEGCMPLIGSCSDTAEDQHDWERQIEE